MGGRGTKVSVRNGFKHWPSGEPDWQIRRFIRQENPLRRAEVTVPQTDTGGREEYSKALG